VAPGSSCGARVAALVVVLTFAGGCATGPGGSRASGSVAAATDWESFGATRASLRSEIDEQSREIEDGPIADRAAVLASLRLVATAADLIDSGSRAGARAALDRAVLLFDGNGYAYLWLAYLDHSENRPAKASAALAKARRDLPAQRKVRAELEGLAQAIGAPPPK
jgi:hypothetical protein